jgi:hypothetical protein
MKKTLSMRIQDVFEVFLCIAFFGAIIFLPIKACLDSSRYELAQEEEKAIFRSHIDGETVWVKVKNKKGIRNYNNYFEHGDDCVILLSQENENVESTENGKLVRYKTKHDFGGTLCPDGTLFIKEE